MMSPVRRPSFSTLSTAPLDQLRFVDAAERIAQAHREGEDARDRIGQALARDVRGGAVDRLVRARAASRSFASFSPSEADGSMPIEPVACAASSDSTSPNRLSVTMTSNCFGPPHQLHGAIVGEDVRELHVAIFRIVQLLHFLAPQHAGVHDVRFLGRGHFVRAQPREIERDAGDALDLAGRIDLRVHRAARRRSFMSQMPRGSPK